jgi:hypothetical protein
MITHAVLGIALLNHLAASWLVPFVTFEAAIKSVGGHESGPRDHKDFLASEAKRENTPILPV